MTGMGSCAVRQMIRGDQFDAQGEMNVDDAIAAKFSLPPSWSTDGSSVTDIVILDGKTYVRNSSSDNMWRVVANTDVSALVGEMNCLGVLDALSAAASAVTIGGGGTVMGRPAKTYQVRYDKNAWASAVGDAVKPGSADSTMVVSVIDGQLAQLEVTAPQARATTYLWFPETADVVAPPADLIAQ